jgi:hypothetical protein
MAYQDVDTAFSAAKTAGDLKGKIAASFVRRSVARLGAVGNNEDQREANVCRQVVAGTYPQAWILMVMERLDNASTLTNPTDAQIDTAVAAAWARIIAAQTGA